MSQFDEEKVGAPSDPTQKTLTDYLLSGDTSRKNTEISLDSGTIDHCLIHGEETCLSKKSHETYPCDHGDPLDGNDLSNVDDHKSTLVNTFKEKEKLDESTSNAGAEKVCILTKAC